MLNRMQPSVYNKTPKQGEFLCICGYALFARLKNHMNVFQKVRKAKMGMLNNAKYVDWLKIGNTTKKILKFFFLNIKDGLIEIRSTFSETKGLITTVIRKGFWKRCVSHARRTDIEIQKLIAKEIVTKSIVTILWLWPLNWVISRNLIVAINVKTIVAHKLIIMIIQSLWTLSGFVENVMEKSTEHLCQRDRLNLWAPKGDAIVKTTEETCREKSEVVSPPRNWSVSLAGLKVIEWLRHTAGCSFYQGQCITNDLWIQNLRSTGI